MGEETKERGPRGPLLNRKHNEPEREFTEKSGRPYHSRSLKDQGGRAPLTNNAPPVKEDEPEKQDG